MHLPQYERLSYLKIGPYQALLSITALYLCVQALEIFLQLRLEVLPCHAVHSRSPRALKRTELLPQPVDSDMVQRRERFLLPLLCSLPYTFHPV